MFCRKRSMVAFKRFLRTFSGKRVKQAVFELYLSNGQRVAFKSDEIQELPENVVEMKKRKKGA
jgi:hypothetical protein